MKKITSILRFLVCLLLLFVGMTASAQMPGGTPVEVSNQTQMMNGKKYYIHVVQPGQTVYAIAKAYGLKAYDAVVKKDIHFLAAGDTVWLPCNGQPVQQSSSVRLDSGNGKKSSTTQVSAEPTVQPAVIRERVNKNTIVVSVLLPLYLDKLSEISTTKFDLEQRGKKSYKQFDFVQFYEGMRLGLDILEQRGYNVKLNVVDVSENKEVSVSEAWTSHDVAQSDFVVALLPKEAFAKAAELAKRDHLFIVNPMAERSEIVQDNPYVFKCMPSSTARITSVVRYIQKTNPSAQIFLIHSDAPAEKPILNEFESQFSQQNGLKYTVVDWNKLGKKFSSTLNGHPNSVIISLYNRDKDRNRIYINTLLNQLSALKNKNLTLITLDDWTMLYNDADFVKLQHANYHTFMNGWDYGNATHADFLKAFRDRYKTEPISAYAGMGNDIILYFVTGLQQKGTEFWKHPNVVVPNGLLYPMSFSQQDEGHGFENKTALLFRMVDYKFVDVRK
ncbi:MAG: ABC transporter substrate-binding protein [Bacteroidales bacterium]|nr:ABC transporter substrate-binding protein [Bacteroidales bacterium]